MFVVYSAAGVPCYRTSDEAEAMKQENVILWEEEEPGEWWAVYREDLII